MGFVAIVAGSIAIAFVALLFSPEAREQRAMADLQEAEGELVQGENQ